MEAIFPPGDGREQLLNGCTGCHIWVAMVIVDYDRPAWERNAADHRDRVSAMSDEDFEKVYEYLIKNFPVGHPIPDLPQELLEQWTSY